jgi:hypothetical protein
VVQWQPVDVKRNCELCTLRSDMMQCTHLCLSKLVEWQRSYRCEGIVRSSYWGTGSEAAAVDQIDDCKSA